MFKWLSLIALVVLLFVNQVHAVVYPTLTPTGETPGGTFQTYFDNMYLTTQCNTTLQVVAGFSSTGVPICVTPTTAGFSLLGQTAGDTVRYNGTDWVRTNFLYNNGTRIGIANQSPTAELDVNWQVRIRGGSPWIWKYLISDATGTASWTWVVAATSFSITGSVLWDTLYYNGTNWVRTNNIFHTGGNVGIGTTTPGAKLEVAWQIKITGGFPWSGRVLVSDSGGTAIWTPASSLDGVGGFNFPWATDYASIDVTSRRWANQSDMVFQLADDGEFAQDRFVFQLDGYTGWPTPRTYPPCEYYTSNSGTTHTRCPYHGTQQRYPLIMDGTQAYFFSQMATWGGNYFSGATAGNNPPNKALGFGAAGGFSNAVLSIDWDNKRVGINTISPMYGLDVNWTWNFLSLRMPTWAGSGKVLTSDSSGLASWQVPTVSGINGGQVNYIARWLTNTTLGTGSIYDNGANVGIGTTSPSAILDVVGWDARVNGLTLGRWGGNILGNSVFGFSTFSNNVTWNNNVAIWGYALGSNISWVNNVWVGYNAGNNVVTGNNNIAIGYNTVFPSSTWSNQLNIGNWLYGVNWKLAIGTTSPTYSIDVQGSWSIIRAWSGFCIGMTASGCLYEWTDLNDVVRSTGTPNYIAKFNSGWLIDNSQIYETGGRLYMWDIPWILSWSTTIGYFTVKASGSTSASNPFFAFSTSLWQECSMWISGTNRFGSNCSWGAWLTWLNLLPNQVPRADSTGNSLTGGTIFNVWNNVGIGISSWLTATLTIDSGINNTSWLQFTRIAATTPVFWWVAAPLWVDWSGNVVIAQQGAIPVYTALGSTPNAAINTTTNPPTIGANYDRYFNINARQSFAVTDVGWNPYNCPEFQVGASNKWSTGCTQTPWATYVMTAQNATSWNRYGYQILISDRTDAPFVVRGGMYSSTSGTLMNTAMTTAALWFKAITVPTNRSDWFYINPGVDQNNNPIAGGGNIGIWTISPTTKLDINWQIKITDWTQWVWKILTSDANGLATWTNGFSGSVTASGIVWWTQGYLTRFGTGGNGIVNSLLFQTGWFIAIGSTTPASTFEIWSWATSILHMRWTNNLWFWVASVRTATSGSSNVGFGANTLRTLTTWYSNTAMGVGAGYNTTSGFFNSAFGESALYSNGIGNWNSALGTQALWTNLDGDYNVAFGWQALYSNLNNDNNVAIGYQALRAATANNNIAIWYQAGSGITTGANNIVIGTNINPVSNTASNQLNIGNWIYGSGGNIGIGTGGTALTARLTLDSGTNNISWLRISRITPSSPTATGTIIWLWVDTAGNVVPISNGDVVVYDGIWRNGTAPSPNPDVGNRRVSYDFNRYFSIPTKQSFVVSDGNGAGYNAPYFKEDGVSGICSWNGAGGTSPYDCGTADPYTWLSASPNNSFTMTARGYNYGYQIALGARGDAPLFARSGKWYNGTTNYASGLYLANGTTPSPWQKVLTVPANHIEYFYVNIGYNSQLQEISWWWNIGMGTSTPDMRLVLAYSGSTWSTSEMMRIERWLKWADANMITSFGTPYLMIGGQENRTNSIQTIGFWYNTASSFQPAEIWLVTTNTTGNTLGDLIFATRSVTTNTAPTERMRIASNGNIAIGTGNTSWTAKLKVDGQIQITWWWVASGHILMSDSTGLWYWRSVATLWVWGFNYNAATDYSSLNTIEVSADKTDMVFQLADNAIDGGDRFVFQQDQWSNVNDQRYPLVMNGLYAAFDPRYSLSYISSTNRYATGALQSATAYMDYTNRRFGIGTLSPQQQLHVNGGSWLGVQAWATDAVLSNGTNIVNIVSPTQLTTNALTTPETAMRLVRAGTNSVKYNPSADFQIGTYTTGINALTKLNIRLWNWATQTPDTDIMTLAANGNVGIWNTAPNAPLQFSNAVQNRKIVLYESANNDHQYYGLGINASTLRYQLDSTTANHIFYAATSSTTSNELMRIAWNGNVGIGTTGSPTAKLEVNGQIKINGWSPGTWKVLTSDANGLATWQAPSWLGGFSRYTYTLASAQSKTANTLSDLWLTSVSLPVGTYNFRMVGWFRTTATTTGIGFALVSNGATVTNYVWRHVVQTTANAAQVYSNGTLGSALLSTWVPAINTDYMTEFLGTFTITTAWSVKIQYQSEVNGSSVTVQPGTNLVIEQI